MIHGHSKIELTNVNTGEVQIIEHDNLVTNYLRDVLTPVNALGDSVAAAINSGDSPLDISKLAGGLIAFEDTLDNSPDNYAYPLDNDMTAHAGNDVYSGTDLTRGSFNSGESSVTSNSATFVWDFNQSQGNGTISSVGLTTIWGGIAGSGNPEKTDTVAANNPQIIRFIRNIIPSLPNNQYAYFDDQNESLYQVSWSTPDLTITKYHFPILKNVDIFKAKYRYDREITTGVELNNYYFDSSSVVSPHSTGYQISGVVDSNGKYYFTTSTSWNSGTSKTIDEIDLATGTITQLSITNNTGVNLSGTSQTPLAADWTVYNGILYGHTSDGKWVYINLSDDTDCGVIKTDDGNDFVLNEWMICNYFGRLYIGNAAWSTSSGKTQVAIVYEKGKVRFMDACMRVYQGSSPSYRSMNSNTNQSSKHYSYLGEVYNSNAPLISIIFNPLCLVTKNNLSAPVTKTSEMTMRVTYTLTKS